MYLKRSQSPIGEEEHATATSWNLRRIPQLIKTARLSSKDPKKDPELDARSTTCWFGWTFKDRMIAPVPPGGEHRARCRTSTCTSPTSSGAISAHAP
jgi:hypothetical protein